MIRAQCDGFERILELDEKLKFDEVHIVHRKKLSEISYELIISIEYFLLILNNWNFKTFRKLDAFLLVCIFNNKITKWKQKQTDLKRKTWFLFNSMDNFGKVLAGHKGLSSCNSSVHIGWTCLNDTQTHLCVCVCVQHVHKKECEHKRNQKDHENIYYHHPHHHHHHHHHTRYYTGQPCPSTHMHACRKWVLMILVKRNLFYQKSVLWLVNAYTKSCMCVSRSLEIRRPETLF